MNVIGTAGHVDHGKTLLIEALTGINTDRLPEEKRRGLTIDLGFAHLFTPEGEAVGVIDVPGHERFIRNMVAGAWSLDLALLTVAADDGWMQQSTDHTQVLRLLGVPRLIIVVTKADLADDQRIRRVTEQAAERCRRIGYPGAPAIAVSAREGRGIEELKNLILRQLRETATSAPEAPGGGDTGPGRGAGPQASRTGAAHLYVDRAFSIRGSGAVVTGSLRGGPLERGEELLLLPRNVRVRVRSLQSYHEECERAEPVSRVAVNLSGVDAGEVGRGDLLTRTPHCFRVVREFIARVQPPPGCDEPPPLRRDTEVELAAGTGHQIARLSRFASDALVRIRCTRPVALMWNQPIVLIRQGGSAILGGGNVLWLERTARKTRLLLSELEPDLPAELGLRELGRLRLAVTGVLTPEETEELEPGPELKRETAELGGWTLSLEHRRRLESRIRELAAAPGGVRVNELATKMRDEPRELLRLLALSMAERHALELRDGVLFPSGGGQPQVSPLGRQLLRELGGTGPRGLEANILEIAGARKELRNLVRAGLAVSLDGNIHYDRPGYLRLVRTCLEGLGVGDTLTIAAAKSRTGLSRKYVIPLLNRMESDGLVRRSGNDRIVTARPEQGLGHERT